MAEVVRQGIEKAEADLEKENQEKLLQAVIFTPLFEEYSSLHLDFKFD